MLHSRLRRRKLRGATLQGGNEVKVPGVGELRTMCSSAHRVSRLCSLLGVGESDQDDELLDGDTTPYIWDVTHA
ncbi:MAG: hypothetical protein BMS9Abin29_2509 [Gemmatimonadota bacterium]|nr:MAG: hypothetical protein BMS9Abin29_2509 [Gemmatimonadota bacterium]